jgi:hypothetical protein
MPIAPAMLALAIAACGTGAAQGDSAAQAPLEAPVSAPSAYVVFAAVDMDRGWTVLEAMDTELPADQRSRIQTRGLVSGGSSDMMIRFAGECAKDDGFVAAVGAVAKLRDVRQVRCVSTLPGN